MLRQLTVGSVMTIVMVLAAPNTADAQSKAASKADIVKSFQLSAQVGKAGIEARKTMSTLGQKGFIGAVQKLRAQLDPIMVNIATTRAPKDAMQLALLVAMGAKGVELSFWYWTNGALNKDKAYMDYGDGLMKAAMAQLKKANDLLKR